MANATYTTLNATTNSTQLVAANARRVELIVTNNSVATLYLSFGATKATSTNFVVALPFGGTFITAVNDQVNGAWSSAASGQANVTEVY